MFRSCWHQRTHHGQLPGQTDVRWSWFQTVPFPEVLAHSLHLQERMLTVWQQCLLWFLKKMYYIIHMASLSLFELFGLSFACTGKNGDLIARASRKNFCSNCRESPQWPPKQMASRQALLGKDILDTEPGVAGTTLLITVNCQDRLKSGGHGFKPYRSRRCWLHHCIRQKTARKNVGGLPTMPDLFF